MDEVKVMKVVKWPAIKAAHRQLKIDVDLKTLNQQLRTSYDGERQRPGTLSRQPDQETRRGPAGVIQIPMTP